MRKITLFLMSLFLTVGAMAQVDYTPNFTGAKTRTTRMVNTITVGNDTHTMSSGTEATRNSYTDLTGTNTFTVQAGTTVSLGMTDSGSETGWMNAFVYVDMDKNGFTAGIDGDNYTPTGDLVSYSFYNQGYSDDNNGRNSAGTSISGGNRSTLALPNWTVPADLTPGEYRIRFKYDWCNINPAGDTESYFGNTFTGHGGEIIDAKLIVEGRENYVHNENSINRNDRGLTSFTITDGENELTISSIQTSSTSPVYIDKSECEFTTTAGATLKFTEFNYTGSWMHAYAYVDYNNDKFFTLEKNNDGTNEGEIVSYNYYDGTTINGATQDNSNAMSSVYNGSKTLPAFTLPADLEPGEYRMRIKIDWNNLDADKGASDIAGNGGCQCDITIVIIEPCTITYNYKEGDKLIASISHETYVGADYPELASNIYGVTFVDQKPIGEVEGNEVVEIQVTTGGIPFEFAASYDKIGNNWYYLSIGQSAHLLYHVEGQDHIALNKTEVDEANKDAYLWAFVGSPFDGYKLVNRAKGDGWILSSSTNTFDNNTGGNTYPIMTEEPVGEGKNTYWIPTASTNLGDGGFYLAQKDANNGMNRMNNRDNILAYWNRDADHGSTFKVRHMDAIEPVIFEWSATTTWTAVDAASCTSSLVWDNQYTGGIKYIQGSITVDTPVKADVTFTYRDGDKRLNIRGVEIIDANGNVVAGDYHVGHAGSSHDDNIYSVKVAEAGTYTVRCYATEGQYQSNGTTNNDTFDNTYGTIRVDMTKFDAKKLTKSVTFAAEYATLYLGYKVAIPNGVKAYVAVSTNNDHVQFAEVTGVIPALTPVLLENVGTSNTYEFAYTTNSAATVETNLLKGSIANRYVVGDAYVLGYINEEGASAEVGFGKAVTEGLDEGTFLNNANKAYLPATSVAGAFLSASLRFDFGGTTAIEEVETEATETVIYDLTGRRVNEITKAGVYIINGKKTLVK